jgi:hypothetical protein
MVYMSGGKAARNQASIVNRTNVCGGNKKAGLAPTIGVFVSSNPQNRRATNTQLGQLICMGNYSNPSQVAARAIKRY